jgi:hypothetical protein
MGIIFTTKENMTELYITQGLTDEQIAARFGVSGDWVYKIRKRFGIKAHLGHKYNIEDRLKVSIRRKIQCSSKYIPYDKLVALYQIYSSNDIAKLLHVSPSFVVVSLHKYGIQLRNVSQAASLAVKQGKMKQLKMVQGEGDKSLAWKGGRIKVNGYFYNWSPGHPNARRNNHGVKIGYVAEHHLVMEKILGRYLKDTEVVHHIDFNTSNNKPENLRLFQNLSEHSKYHAQLRTERRLLCQKS